MKRTIKAVSAAIVSICLLALNLPFFSIEVFADDTSAPQGPEFFVCEDAQGGLTLSTGPEEPIPPDSIIKLDGGYNLTNTVNLVVDGTEVYRFAPPI